MSAIVNTPVRIDGTNVKDFETEMKNAFDTCDNQLDVDMADTTYLCSAALRVFLSTQKKIRAAGGSMVLKNVKPQIIEIFEVTGFAGILTIE